MWEARLRGWKKQMDRKLQIYRLLSGDAASAKKLASLERQHAEQAPAEAPLKIPGAIRNNLQALALIQPWWVPPHHRFPRGTRSPGVAPIAGASRGKNGLTEQTPISWRVSWTVLEPSMDPTVQAGPWRLRDRSPALARCGLIPQTAACQPRWALRRQVSSSS